jgi:hypothetical protein
VHKTAVDFKMSNRRAVLRVRNLPVIDTFQFFGPSDTPALVDFRVEWRASGPAVARGEGDSVPPTDPAAFLGQIAPGLSTISCSGEEIGFEFDGRARTDLPDELRGWAQIGTHRNGVFLD